MKNWLLREKQWHLYKRKNRKEREHFNKGSHGKEYSSEAALSLRSRRNGTKFAAPLLAELLIKYQRLPRGFFWNYSLP